MLDLKITGGDIIDGTGAPAYRADIGVKDGRIVSIGEISDPAEAVVDAKGKVVCPGFVDSHTHYDAQVFWDPYLSPSCYHGVTTVLGGNCGFSIAPLTPGAADYLGPMLARVEGMPLATLKAGVPWDWTSFGSYLDRLEGGLGVNAGFFVGHSAVRRAIMGQRAVGHAASDGEIASMQALVQEALEAGALGFSTTVSPTHNDGDGNPVPSRHALPAELLALASVCSRYEGTSLELLPDLAFDEAMVELITDFSLAGQRTVNWNVLDVQNADSSTVADIRRKLAVSDYARSKGGKVVALAFVTSPRLRINFGSGMLFDSIPGWEDLFRIPKSERLEKLKDSAFRAFLFNAAATAELAKQRQRLVDWPNFTLEETFSAATKPHQGRTVGEVAAEQGKTPFEAMLDIVVADELKTTLCPRVGGIDRDTYALRAQVWQDEERVVVGASDAGAHMDMIDTFAFSTTLLQDAVRTHQVLTLESAVHLLTEVPAKMMGLRQRGVIRSGWFADLVVFDPATVGRTPAYTRFDLPCGEPRIYADATGIELVAVNGVVIVAGGQHTGATPGVVLRSGRDTYTVPIPAALHAPT